MGAQPGSLVAMGGSMWVAWTFLGRFVAFVLAPLCIRGNDRSAPGLTPAPVQRGREVLLTHAWLVHGCVVVLAVLTVDRRWA